MPQHSARHPYHQLSSKAFMGLVAVSKPTTGRTPPV